LPFCRYKVLKASAVQDREDVVLTEAWLDKVFLQKTLDRWQVAQRRFMQLALVQLETFALAQRASSVSAGAEKYVDELSEAKAERRQLRSDGQQLRSEVERLGSQLAAVKGEKERLSAKFEREATERQRLADSNKVCLSSCVFAASVPPLSPQTDPSSASPSAATHSLSSCGPRWVG
jgi:hypothetical protein